MISSLLDAVATTQNPLPDRGRLAAGRLHVPVAAPVSPVPAEEDVFIFPATPAQRRFWLLDQLVPGGNPALNMPLALRLRGELHVPALERACQEVVRRHEALRTTFHCEKGRLLQVIAPRRTPPLTVVDVSDLPPVERAQVPAHFLADEARQPFDLATGPLLRLRLVRWSPCEHLLLCPVHHIVADGWSNGIFVRELGALYAAFVRGKPSPLGEPTVQFADFAQWQSDRLEAGGFDAQLDYWRARLAGELPVLDLPVDHPRLPWRGQTAPSAVRERRLPPALAAALKALAVREGASPFMVFLAAFAVLLHRYGGGQEDLVVGTSTANRDRLEVEGVIGLFVNPLMLRLDLSGAPTFRELLTQVRRRTLEAFEHADAPFEKLVEELQPRRLQVNFLYQQDFVQSARWLDLAVTPAEAGTGGAVYEWNVLAVEDAAGVRLHCEYHAGLFDAATIERMLGDFEGLLAAVAAEGVDQRAGELPLPSTGTGASAPCRQLRAEAWRLPETTVAWISEHVGLPPQPTSELYTPPTGWRFAVLDGHGQPTPIGVPGELCLVDAAASSFKTGDIARVQADGTVEWIGPSGTECKVNGLRVDRRRIERVLRAHPHVRQAVVLWRNDAAGQPLLTAYCQGDGAPAVLLAAAQLQGFLQENLPDEWIPAAFVLLENFPLTADGRLDALRLPPPRSEPEKPAGQTHDVPYLSLHHQIIEIWREVLQVRSVGLRDDFFALGGNSLLAMRLLYRVEQAFGKAILPATLFQRATVEHLADEILKSAGGPGSREIVRVQENGACTPIFYLHGDIAGGGFYCLKFSRGLGDDQPFYALPPVEVANPLEDRPTVEQMAAAHVATIRSVRPHGPYVLGGFCLGGLIAYEVACQLERAGEQVERLLVIDAGPSDRRLTALRRGVERVARWRKLDGNRQLYLFCRWHYWLARLDRFRALGVRERVAGIRRRWRAIFCRSRAAGKDAATLPGADTAWFDPRLDVPLIFLWAVGGYRPGSYGGAVTLLLSSDVADGAEGGDPTSVWRRLVSNVETKKLNGNHLACITEHVASLAATVRASLTRVEPGGLAGERVSSDERAIPSRAAT